MIRGRRAYLSNFINTYGFFYFSLEIVPADLAAVCHRTNFFESAVLALPIIRISWYSGRNYARIDFRFQIGQIHQKPLGVFLIVIYDEFFQILVVFAHVKQYALGNLEKMKIKLQLVNVFRLGLFQIPENHAVHAFDIQNIEFFSVREYGVGPAGNQFLRRDIDLGRDHMDVSYGKQGLHNHLMDMVAMLENPQDIGIHFLAGRVLELKKNRPGAFARVGNIKVMLFFVLLPIQIKFVDKFFKHYDDSINEARQQVIKVVFGGLSAWSEHSSVECSATGRENRSRNWAGNFEGRYFETSFAERNYLFAHWGALLSLFNPNFFLSLILGSLIKYPAFFSRFLKSGLNNTNALEIPCLTASA